MGAFAFIALTITAAYAIPKVVRWIWPAKQITPPLIPTGDGSFTSVPKDVAAIIFSNLPDHELAKAREVSRRFNSAICDNPQLNNRLHLRSCMSSCIKAAYAAVSLIPDPTVQDSLYRDVHFMELLVGSDEKIQAAKIAAYAIQDPIGYRRNRALTTIFYIELEKDMQAAKATALTMEGIWKDEALLSIVGKEAELDPLAAKAKAALIDDPSWKCEAYQIIAKFDSQHDIRDAEAIALTIDDPISKLWRLLKVAEIDPLHDFTAVQAIIQEIENPVEKTKALLKIAKWDRQHDLTAAKTCARLIEDSERQAYLLCKIVKVEALHDIAAAKSTAQMIEPLDPLEAAAAYFEIMKIEATQDLKAAQTTADAIQDSYYRTMALLHIAKITSDFTAAKAMAQMIEDTAEESSMGFNQIEYKYIPTFDRKISALISIAEADPQHDLTAVKETIELIDNPYFKSRMLIKIAGLAHPFDPTEALKVALTIDHPLAKEKALMKIAKAIKKRLKLY